MAMIYVRAKPGRKAFFEGKVIPEDKFIPVPDTPYIRRLRDHWGDIEAQSTTAPAPKPAPYSPPKPAA
jgi:hypothetical protein